MNKIGRIVIGFLFAGVATLPSFADQTIEKSTTNTAKKPNISTLLSGRLERVEGTEFIVSRVQIPPNMSLPKHWHPGEEFVYVVKGQLTLWQDGKDDLVFTAGDAAKVPLKQVHTAITGDAGVDLVVFRVHEKGKPERVLTGDSGKK
jgi:quercetin dioxygenase-like cupin family protein